MLHDVLHSFRQGRGAGTAIIEVKLEQQLAGIFNETSFQVFIDIRKAYNSLDQGTCMEILRDYGLGTRLQILLQRYWDLHRVVTKAGNYYGRPFRAGRGLTQGDPFYPTLFNIIVGTVVKETLLPLTTRNRVEHLGVHISPEGSP